MLGLRPAPRVLEHRDGRRCEARLEGTKLLLSIRDAEGDTVERTRTFADGNAAMRALEDLVREQLEDGFVEVSEPAWRVFLGEVVALWKQDDPAFDVEALRAAVTREHVEAVMAIADRYVSRPDGTAVLEFDFRPVEEYGAPFERDPASLPALLLGLRHPDHGAQLRVDAILGRLRRPASIEAILSVLEHPAPNRSTRAVQHFPTHALVALGVPSIEVGERLARALDHEDFRVAAAAAGVLAEHAVEDRLFAPLFAHVERGKREESFAWTLMRAAEVRKDEALRPFLEWMQKSRRFRSAGYPERIREALAGLAR